MIQITDSCRAVLSRLRPELEALIKTMVDEKAVKEDVLGVVVPHAGYPYSGPVVGAVYRGLSLKILLSSWDPTIPGGANLSAL